MTTFGVFDVLLRSGEPHEGDCVIVRGSDLNSDWTRCREIDPEAVLTAEVLVSSSSDALISGQQQVVVLRVLGYEGAVELPLEHPRVQLFARLSEMHTTTAVGLGQWVLESAAMLRHGASRDQAVNRAHSGRGMLLSMIVSVGAENATICVPGALIGADNLPELFKVVLSRVRLIRASSSAALREVPATQTLRVPVPATLDDVPLLDRAALAKAALLHAIQNVLRSNAKQEKQTDCRYMHLHIDDWRELTSPEFCGSLSKISRNYPFIETFDAYYLHQYVSAPVQYSQSMIYRYADHLERLASWLGQPNFNMYRRGCRPPACRPRPVSNDQMNVVHPSFPWTKILFKYNISTRTLRVTTSYQRTQSLFSVHLPNFLPRGSGCIDATQQQQQQQPLTEPRETPAADEYTDEVLMEAQIDIDDGTYEVTSVGLTCELCLVHGHGPQTRSVTRFDLVPLVAASFSLD
jgi:hypothetical protein